MTRSNWLILGLAVLAAVIGGYLQPRPSPEPASGDTSGSSMIGQPAPNFVLADEAGKTHRLADYHGRRVLVNFWATWCAPCLREMPALAQAQTKFGERSAIVLGIGMDEPHRIHAFLVDHPVNYPILLGDADATATLKAWGNPSALLPYNVLIGADGRIMATHEGSLSSTQMQQWLTAPVN